MRYRLEAVGPGKINGDVEVEDEQQLYLEVRKHAGGSEISLYTEDKGQTYSVLVGTHGKLSGKCVFVS